MKKTTLLILMLFMGALSFAQTLNEPANWPSTDWSITGSYQTGPAYFEANPTVDGTFAFDDFNGGNGSFGLSNTIAAESPVIDLTAAQSASENSIFFSADYVYNFFNQGALRIEYWDADTTAWQAWGDNLTGTPGAPQNNFCTGTPVAFTSSALDISGFTATQLTGFRYRIYFTDNDEWIRGFCMSSPTIYSQGVITCPSPSDIVVSNTTDTTAEISWTAGDIETAWYVAIVPEGAGAPTTSGIAVTANPYTLTGLDALTDYDVYVMANCGDDDTSSWVGPVSFSTENVPPTAPNGVACGVDVPSSFIFTEDFDEPGFWTGDVNNNSGSWEIPDGSTTVNTGPNAAYSGDNFMSFEATEASGATGAIVSPEIDLAGAVGEIELSFYMYAYGAGMGTLEVGVATDAAGPFTNVFTWEGEYQTGPDQNWIGVAADLTSYAGETIYVEFKQTATATGLYYAGDMAIDYMRIEACGEFCIAPANVIAENLTDTTAELSWTANNGETSWEYMIVPTGTTPDMENGIVATSLPVSITGLDPDTTYDVYVMADCGNDFYSIWTNPYTFTTEIQTEFSVDCAVGPTNVTHCYGNNEVTTFHFTGTDPSMPLRVTFNTGSVENSWDLITISDSEGVVYSGYGNAGNLTGFVVDGVVGPDLYIEIQSDGSNSCASGSQNSWDFDVNCITCISPTVDYTVVSDCLNGEQFLVDVEITDVGDAASITIVDDQGNEAQVVDGVGVSTFGPYPNGTEVSFTVANTDDANCTLISDPMTQVTCPPDFDPACSTVYAGNDVTVDCGAEEIELQASYIVSGTDSNSYQLNGISCDPQIEPGTATGISIDDTYSGVIDLGFTFCFFGNNYDQVVIGANGLISFDTNLAGAFCPWSFNASVPSPALPRNAIFGVYHDINPGTCGQIEYVQSGVAPNRTFTVNFDEVCHFSCTTLTSTTQIILYEASGAIEINIIDKPTCTGWNGGNAVAGLQNSTGTIGFTPPDRNTGPWSASNESWRYVPGGPANYTFEWFDGDVSLGSNPDITVSPNETTTYTAQIVYNRCNGETATVTDDVTITVENSDILANQPDDMEACDDISNDGFLEFDLSLQDDAILGELENAAVTYHETIEDANAGVNPLSIPYTNDVAYMQTVYARVEDINTGCFDITSFDLIVYNTPILIFDNYYEVCSNGIEPAVLYGAPVDFDPDSADVTFEWTMNGEVIPGANTNSYDAYNSGTFTVTVTTPNCSNTYEIVVAESGDCIIPQGISPDTGDNVNENFDLDGFNISQINIFDRLGTEVYSRANYTDEWHGQDKNGSKLPVGTYFYVLTRQDGTKLTGWVYVNREN